MSAVLDWGVISQPTACQWRCLVRYRYGIDLGRVIADEIRCGSIARHQVRLDDGHIVWIESNAVYSASNVVPLYRAQP